MFVHSPRAKCNKRNFINYITANLSLRLLMRKSSKKAILAERFCSSFALSSYMLTTFPFPNQSTACDILRELFHGY